MQQHQKKKDSNFHNEPGGFIYFDSRQGDLHWKGSVTDIENAVRADKPRGNTKKPTMGNVDQLVETGGRGSYYGAAAKERHATTRPQWRYTELFEQGNPSSLRVDVFEDDNNVTAAIGFPAPVAAISEQELEDENIKYFPGHYRHRLKEWDREEERIDLDIIGDDSRKTITFEIVSDHPLVVKTPEEAAKEAKKKEQENQRPTGLKARYAPPPMRVESDLSSLYHEPKLDDEPMYAPTVRKEMQLPDYCSLDQITAHFDSRILTVTIPKQQSTKEEGPKFSNMKRIIQIRNTEISYGDHVAGAEVHSKLVPVPAVAAATATATATATAANRV